MFSTLIITDRYPLLNKTSLPPYKLKFTKLLIKIIITLAW